MLLCPRSLAFARLALAMLVPLACALAQTAPQHAEPVRARALLIGIGQYASPAMPALGGPRNDVARIAHVLVTRFGFESEAITTLLDAEATRARILDALAAAARATGPNDVLFVHWSGHGSQVVDLNGDEDDGLDETLVPHDGRTPGIADIVDDELDGLLGAIASPHVVVVLDACHAGTGTRVGAGVLAQRREVPAEDGRRLALYEHLRVQRRAGTETGLRHVLLTGAAAEQTALDGPVEGRCYGFFSWALATALARAPAEAGVRALFADAVREHRRLQQRYQLVDLRAAQLEAPTTRLGRPLLPPLPGAAARSWLAVRAGPAPDVLQLERGTELGAMPGSYWAVYAPGERRFAMGRALAWGRVEGLEGTAARLRLAWRAPSATDLTDGRAVQLTGSSEHGLPVRIEGGDERERERTRAALQAAIPNLAFVGDAQFARFLVELQPVAHRVLGADGLEPILSVPASVEGTRRIARLIARSVLSSELLSLDNPGSTMQLHVAIQGHASTRMREVPRQRGIRLVAASGESRFRIRAPEEPRSVQNSLVLEITAGQPCYLTIVDVDSEGGVHVLFPNEISEQRGFVAQGRVEAGRTVRIPDGIADDNAAQFWFDYCAPAGIDTVRVFATEDLQTAELLRSALHDIAAAPRTIGDAVTELHDPRQELIAALRQRLSAVAARGIRIVANTPAASAAPAEPEPQAAGDWTATSVTIHVQER